MRKALVVGFNNYPDAPLTGCINDALRIASILERNADGSPNFSIVTLTDETDVDGDLVTKKNLRLLLEELFKDDNDMSLFYFSGHGSVSSTGGAILTPDSTEYADGISMDDILKIANKSRCKDKVIIFDCCHSGHFGNLLMDDGNTTMLSEGLTILTASRGTGYAFEDDGRGIFTSLVEDALYGGASDLRGYVTPSSVYSYVDSALGPWDQRPVFKTNVTRFSHLRKVTPPIPIEVLRELPELFKSAEEEFDLNPTYEDTEPTAIQENVVIFKKLQKMFSVGLVVPVDEEYMYYAAINSKSCKLTATGYHYWRLAKEGKL